MRNIILAFAVACVAAGCATKQVERTSFRFMHWSVSHFSEGGYSVASIPDSEGKAMAAKYVKFLDSVDADVVGISQYNEDFTTNGSMKASTALFGGYEKAIGPAKGDICNAIFFKSGKATKIEEKTVFFERHFEDTYYKAVKLNVSGVPIWFVQTHLDSNTYLSGQVFEKAGYELANLFGTGTYPLESPLQPIDNIIMKGLEISEVRFLEGGRLSDHLAISCKLTVYGQK